MSHLVSPGGGIGRHKGLKIPRQQWRAGSSPAPGTIYSILWTIFLFLNRILNKLYQSKYRS